MELITKLESERHIHLNAIQRKKFLEFASLFLFRTGANIMCFLAEIYVGMNFPPGKSPFTPEWMDRSSTEFPTA